MEALDELTGILQHLEPSLGPLDGPPVPLEGGITNRNFRVPMGGVEYVVRVHGKDTDLLGISRAAERIAGEAAARLGIAPQVSAGFDGGIVTRYVSCSALSGGEIRERAGGIASALRSFHQSGTVLPVEFHVPEMLRAYAGIVCDRGGELPDAYEHAALLASSIVEALPEQELKPCHNDLLAGNLIRSQEDGHTMIVDWEYAGMGRGCFDLGNLSVNNDFDDGTDELLLRCYHGAEPTAPQIAELKLMRVLSDVREAAWGVMQAHVSELDFDFDGYAELHFARLLYAAATSRRLSGQTA